MGYPWYVIPHVIAENRPLVPPSFLISAVPLVPIKSPSSSFLELVQPSSFFKVLTPTVCNWRLRLLLNSIVT